MYKKVSLSYYPSIFSGVRATTAALPMITFVLYRVKIVVD